MGATEHLQLPRELAELQAKTQAIETDLIARANFSALSESGPAVKKAALSDFNRRIMRLANTMDDLFARAIFKAYATAADYSTLTINDRDGEKLKLQCKHCARMHTKLRRSGQGWTGDLEEYVFVYCREDWGAPNMCVNCRAVIYGGERFIGVERSALRKHVQKLVTAGILTPVGEQTRARGTFDPGQFDAAKYRVSFGLTLVQGVAQPHDFNAPLPDAVNAPSDPKCQHCAADVSHRRSKAKWCGPACKQAAHRARVTDNAHGSPYGVPHGVPHGVPDGTRSTKSTTKESRTSSSTPLRGDERDDEADEILSGEELPSSPLVGVEVAPRPVTSQSSGTSSSSAPREDRGQDDDDEDLWEDIIRHAMPTFQRRALVNRVQLHGLDMDEVEDMLINFICNRLAGFTWPNLGPGGVMDALVEMVRAHRKLLAAEAAAEAAQAATAERDERNALELARLKSLVGVDDKYLMAEYKAVGLELAELRGVEWTSVKTELEEWVKDAARTSRVFAGPKDFVPEAIMHFRAEIERLGRG
jgi:hypothetical protein